MNFKTRTVRDEGEAKPGETMYDIDQGVVSIKEFIKKTSSHAKAFKKLAKRMNGFDAAKQKKDTFKFAKEKLLFQFKINVVEKFFRNDEMSYLTEDEAFTYILGIFIAGNSQEPNIKTNIEKIYAKTLMEICERSMNNRLLNSGS